ncbi:MAG TPA: asparagine synthase-related protein [Thermoplasmata archaeon]|nr:asparagine synthase-related protein [Thermoplasmata archaeon]
MAAADSTSRQFGATELDLALELALQPLRLGNTELGILYSGGVDSSLLAWELRHRPHLTLLTLGSEASTDLRAGRLGAEALGLPWKGLPLDERVVSIFEGRFSSGLAGASPVSKAVLLALGVAIDECPVRSLVCGQGADELFFGYAHYRGLTTTEAAQRSNDDLRRLLEHDWPWTQRVAERLGKTIVAPYLAREFQEAAQRVPLEARLPDEAPKAYFREWARSRGLPESLAARPKKALQYGSGMERLLRRRSRAGR